MGDRIIFHIDVNSAFLSWEAAYRIRHLGGSVDLRLIPSAVGGDMSKRHGIIPVKSTPAKKYKIQTGEPIVDSLRKCPKLVIVAPNYELYQKCSEAFINILRKYSPIVEQYSIDEAFVDMTGMTSLFGSPVIAAHTIKDEIYDRLGFTVNVGISVNKILAKMASDFKKPNMVHTLYPNEIKDKMWPLPVRDLFFVGGATEKKLHSMNIKTIGELAALDYDIIKSKLKKQGELIWKFANGIDTEIVESEEAANKGYGNSTTMAFDVTDADTAKKVLLSLSETVGRRLRKDHVKIQVVSVGIRLFDLSYYSHQMVLDSPTNITRQINEVAGLLFDQMWDGTAIRHLSIQTTRVKNEDEARQLTLFNDTDYEKLEKMDKTVDSIRNRFGTDAIKRAVFTEEKQIDHMTGGISKERRKADYSKEDIK